MVRHFGKADGHALAHAAEAIVKEVARKLAPVWSRTTIEVHLFEVARYLRREHPELSKAAIEAIVWSESYAHK